MATVHTMAEDTELGECITVFLEHAQIVVFLDGMSVGVEIQTLNHITVDGIHATLDELRKKNTP